MITPVVPRLGVLHKHGQIATFDEQT
ncbi:hypothetical protein NP493_75g09005 [Ridgeia piscesae]|uniref:Uncharacterized protein n=1 Tax=Ridgeia piscesae TaxID=27915 RepID=A0AAD9P9E2_RIDPI|nr:hypothetical protein NP493_75g09005 [Ridgeia piscesae]